MLQVLFNKPFFLELLQVGPHAHRERLLIMLEQVFYRPDDIPVFQPNVYIYDMLATNINAIASVCA